MEVEVERLLQDIGDNIANVFEQYLKGSWKDDHGHDVGMNIHFSQLRNSLQDIMEFRTKHFDYSKVPEFKE